MGPWDDPIYVSARSSIGHLVNPWGQWGGGSGGTQSLRKRNKWGLGFMRDKVQAWEHHMDDTMNPASPGHQEGPPKQGAP